MTCNTFIIPQSENTGSYRVISWVSLKGKTPLGTKNSRRDPALPCWFTEEPRAHQESGSCDSDSHTKPRSLSYTEFLLWEQTLPKCIPATDRTWGWTGASRSTRRKWGCTKQGSQADPSPQPITALRLLHALKSSQCKTPEPGSGQNPASPIHGSWNLSYSTTHSTRPSNPPASPSAFWKTIWNLQVRTQSVFSNNFVWHDLKSHNFQTWSTDLWSPLTCNTRGRSSSLQLHRSSVQVCHLWPHNLHSHGPREEQKSAAVTA